jgi:hypothetical protein
MTVDGRRTLMSFVRGQSTWRVLRDLGVQIQLGASVVVIVPSDLPVVSPGLFDVAAGLISHADDIARREWAAVLLAVDNIDLSGLEREKNWPALLEAIWDAAAGRTSEASLAFVRSLVVGSQQMH